MIGQRELLKHINRQIETDKFPRFSIIAGERGSGKRLLASDISKQLGVAVICDIKADAIRNIIEMAYKVADTTVYIIPNIDNMSQSSSNALLKVTEEPPNNAYFICTCENADNVLITLRSRAVTYIMEPYTYEDKCDYIEQVGVPEFEEDENFILDVASNLGEVQQMLNMDIHQFKAYVDLVIDNIAEVSGSNAFKIAEKVALKDEDNKYELRLFWKAFSSLCATHMVNSIEHDDCLRYGRAVAITGDALQQLNIRGINKQMLFDKWLLDIRGEWM